MNMHRTAATAADVVRALRVVIDPDLRTDIVELGFVHDVLVEGSRASFTIRLTTPACPAKADLERQAHEAVSALPGLDRIDITMDAQKGRDAGLAEELQASLGGVRHILAVASGKGGVGKSATAVQLAACLAARGARVGLLDGDIQGPSLVQMTGASTPYAAGEGLWTPPVAHGLSVVSMAMFLRDRQAAVLRGPRVAHVLRELVTRFDWGQLDYLIVDLPPGTGDVQIRLAELVPITGALVVTTPQEVAVADNRRAIAMLGRLNVPVLGVVETMSGYVCPSCTDLHPLFPGGGGQRLADEYEVPLLGQVPFDPVLPVVADRGQVLVHSAPDSAAAHAYEALAGRVASAVSVAARRR